MSKAVEIHKGKECLPRKIKSHDQLDMFQWSNSHNSLRTNIVIFSR